MADRRSSCASANASCVMFGRSLHPHSKRYPAFLFYFGGSSRQRENRRARRFGRTGGAVARRTLHEEINDPVARLDRS